MPPPPSSRSKVCVPPSACSSRERMSFMVVARLSGRKHQIWGESPQWERRPDMPAGKPFPGKTLDFHHD
jgi:hypothetical protein